MGTRIVFEIADPQGDLASPICVLFANNSHPDLDPEEVFRSAVDNAQSRADLVMALLAFRYHDAGGNHRAGDSVFHFVAAPYGDAEAVWRLTAGDECVKLTLAEARPHLEPLRWMVLNEVEASTERLEHIDPTAAANELRDVEIAVRWLAEEGVDVTEHRRALIADEIADRIREAGRPRYLAKFRGQAWINGNAIEVDDSRWEFPVSAAEVDAAGGFSADSDEAADDLSPEFGDWDRLKDAAGAPPEVKAWAGPFDIDVHTLPSDD